MFEVHDSPLSEAGVLGFDYGYSLAEPNALVLWEAQFGDFVNGAQVIIDQFISSGELKWLRMSLVMLLPHGYEGQGPEHSSARPERFLQLCAEDNWQVANCTTPANYFHILRRQIRRNFRKPLILLTPKSLLRHKACVSTLDYFLPGSSFHRVLWDESAKVPGDAVKRVVLCTGKVYYDLLEDAQKRGQDDVAILRVEQLYPFPREQLAAELKRYNKATEVSGARKSRRTRVRGTRSSTTCRPACPTSRHSTMRPPRSPSPAAGHFAEHVEEQLKLVADALVNKLGSGNVAE